MSYSVQNIRNVCLLGHSGSGKTTLAENLLLMTGAIERMVRRAPEQWFWMHNRWKTKRIEAED